MSKQNLIPALTGLLLLTGLPAAGAQQPPTPTAVPATPAAPAMYISAAKLAEQLQAALDRKADPAASPLGVTEQYSINEVRRDKAGPPAIHPLHTELHYILAGHATFVTGGVIVRPAGQSESVIEGGEAREVHQGDAFIVPANTPHWYRQVDPGMKYLEVRFLAPVPRAADPPKAATP